jgi:hypothetical protein
VLAVPPPMLACEAGHGPSGWAFRHRGLDPDTARLAAVTGWRGPAGHGRVG